MSSRSLLLLLPLLALLACDTESDEIPQADDDDSAAVDPPSVDLTEALGPDEARAGVLTDEHEGAFVGGLAAESQVGDILLYNDRARFVLQGWREGDNHIRLPGTLVDADLVRPADQGGRDGLDEFTLLFNTGRVLTPDTLEVIADGVDGGPAVVRATGVDGPFELLEGVLSEEGSGDAEELIADWCCHLDQGHHVVGTGVSDTHSMLPGPGNTRTWVNDDATDLDAWFAAFKAGQAVISSGPFLMVEASDGDGTTAGVGQTLVADSPTLHIEVYAPSWMDVDEVRLYAGCQLIDTWSVDGDPPLVFEIDTPVDPGSYILVEAEGDASLSPLWSGGHAWALTNPIWLESP